MKVLNYKNWEKRRILILKMWTTSGFLESSLDFLDIPYIIYDCLKDKEWEEKWKTDIDRCCGIIITGSKNNVDYNYEPAFPESIIAKLPVLGICYGHEILGNLLGSEIVKCNTDYGEHGNVNAKIYPNVIFDGLEGQDHNIVTMNHDLMLDKLPTNTELLASTKFTPIAAFHHKEKNWWGLQFHPEKDWLANIVLTNFYKICRNNEASKII